VGTATGRMKVILSTPPGKTTELWPPLGLLYMASSVRSKRKDDIKVIDAFCENLTSDDLLKRVVDEKPDVFGLNCSTHTFLSAIALLHKMKAALPGTKIVLGGYHATFAAERIMRSYPFIDYIIKGEGEESLVQLLQCIEDDSSPSHVGGICYLDGDRLIDNPFTLIENLDALPFPSRDLLHGVHYGYYHQGMRLTFGKFTTICTSRGCPFKCTYCSCAELSLRKWRPRSAENVVDEMEQIYNDGYQCCVVVDDNFTHRKKRVEEVCRLIRERKIKMKFYCEGRVDGASYELMKEMKRSGFDVMYFGVESASQRVLDYYQKHIQLAKSTEAIANAKRCGMLVVTSYIVGAPIETREDAELTVNMIRETRPHGVQVNILDCLVGTPIWNELEESKLVGPSDWETNHRIFEYEATPLSKEEIEQFVVEGYAAHLNGWKTRGGLKDLTRLILKNRTARQIIFNNILSPAARKRIFEELGIEEVKSPLEKMPANASPTSRNR
jgi:radical SAM superfamily enzyme YgiQ (UPF0313 family)